MSICVSRARGDDSMLASSYTVGMDRPFDLHRLEAMGDRLVRRHVEYASEIWLSEP